MASLDLFKWDEDSENCWNNSHLILLLSDKLNDALKQKPNDPNLLWRSAKILNGYFEINKKEGDYSKLYPIILKALTMAKKAVECDQQCFEAHLYCCVCLGNMSEYEPIKKKIKIGNQIKNHLEIAFSLNSTSKELPLLYLIDGIFCYKLATMSWIEKKLVKTFFGALPVVSLENGLNSLIKGQALKPGVQFYLWITKTLITLKKYEQAQEWAIKGLSIGSKAPSDVLCKDELVQLKSKYLK